MPDGLMNGGCDVWPSGDQKGWYVAQMENADIVDENSLS